MNFDDDWNCAKCDEAIPHCDFCDDDGTCRQCAEGYTVSYDRAYCFENFTNCLDEEYTETTIWRETNPLDPTFWIEWEDYKCSECDVGFYWVDYEDEVGGCIGVCSDFDEKCNNCDVEGVCTECGCEWMVWDGACVDKIKNCDVDEEDQPDDLETDLEGNYYCDCNTGFIWDSVSSQCLPCGINKCDECELDGGSLTCKTCIAGYMDDSHGGCMPQDPNCLTTDSGWDCSECSEGYFFDAQGTLRCVSCQTRDPNSATCDQNGIILTCSPGFALDSNGSCTPNNIDYCWEPHSTNGALCSRCKLGYGLSADQKNCYPCSSLGKLCVDCDNFDSNQDPATCTEWALGADLDGELANCLMPMFTLVEVGAEIHPVAYCSMCNDRYTESLSWFTEDIITAVHASVSDLENALLADHAGECLACGSYCQSCTSDIAGDVSECLSCDPGKSLQGTPGSRTCQWNPIEFCESNVQASFDGKCTACEEYTGLYNGLCYECPENCESCTVKRSYNNKIYASCDECEEGFAITNVLYNNDKQII